MPKLLPNMELHTWRLNIAHTCDQQASFEAARTELERLIKDPAVKVDVGPLSADTPNVIRIHVMGAQVIVAVMFNDLKALASITAPASFAWAEPIIRARVEKMIADILIEAGSETVQITDYVSG